MPDPGLNNESGLICEGDFSFPINTVLLIESPTLQALGFPAVNVRIAKIEQKANSEAPFQLLATFVGLSAHEMRRIHAHCLEIAARNSRRASA